MVNTIHAIELPVLHAAQCRQNVILFAYTFPSPFERDVVVPGVGLYPALVSVGALAEIFLAYHRNAEDRSNEMNHLFGPGQPTEVSSYALLGLISLLRSWRTLTGNPDRT